MEHEDPRPDLRLVRTMSCQGSDCQLVAFFNLDDQPRPLPEPVRPGACLLLKSEESQFGRQSRLERFRRYHASIRVLRIRAQRLERSMSSTLSAKSDVPRAGAVHAGSR